MSELERWIDTSRVDCINAADNYCELCVPAPFITLAVTRDKMFHQRQALWSDERERHPKTKREGERVKWKRKRRRERQIERTSGEEMNPLIKAEANRGKSSQ